MKNNPNKQTLGQTFLLLFLLLFLSLAFPCTANAAITLKNVPPAPAGKFINTQNQWIYQYADGTIAKNCSFQLNNQIYCIGPRTYRWYGWHTVNGQKYYFGTKSQGYLQKSKWITYKGNRYCLQSSGVPATGWLTTRYGNRYYFDKDGKSITGTQTIDGISYTFASNGRLIHTGANINVASDCALLIQANTGEVLYAKNEERQHANASTTKIMTCILALENCKLNEKVKVSANAAAQEPTKLYMKQNQMFYLKDLLYSLMLPSHNDTAVAIAEHVSGSVKNFVKLMNQKAKALGCTNTNFATPSGLDAGYNHYTTTKDLAKIAQYALKNNYFRQIIHTSSYHFRCINTSSSYSVYTTNKLLGNQTGVCGMKTGYTKKAGFCFVGVVTKSNGTPYISITLGAKNSQQRWADSRKLLNYAYHL